MKSELKEEDEKRKEREKERLIKERQEREKIKALKNSSTKADLTTGGSISKEAPSAKETVLSY